MFAGFMIAGFLWIVVLLLTIGLACNAVWRAVMAPPGTPREAGCGSCGYELTTLQDGRCSECGADLLKAGVATRRTIVRVGGSLPAAIMGWTILASTGGSIILYAISMISMMMNPNMFGGGNAYDSNFQFGFEQTYDKDTGEFVSTSDYNLTIDLDVDGNWSGPADTGTIVAIMENGDQSAQFRFDDASLTDWVLIGPDNSEVAQGSGVTKTDTLRALSLIGITPDTDPLAPAIASDTEMIIDAAYNDPFNYEIDIDLLDGESVLTQVGGSSYNNINTPNMFVGSTSDWLAPVAVTLGTGLLWLIGLIWIIRRRARLVAGPRVSAA